MRSRQNLSAEENNEARQILRAMGLRPDRNNLHKYKLYLELQEQNYGVTICPYSGQ